jgi:hypothetical protein
LGNRIEGKIKRDRMKNPVILNGYGRVFINKPEEFPEMRDSLGLA